MRSLLDRSLRRTHPLPRGGTDPVQAWPKVPSMKNKALSTKYKDQNPQTFKTLRVTRVIRVTRKVN